MKSIVNWRAVNGIHDIQELPDNVEVKYKVVNVKRRGQAQWEEGDNRSLQLDQHPLAVEMRWNATHNGSVTALPLSERMLPLMPHAISERNGDVLGLLDSSEHGCVSPESGENAETQVDGENDNSGSQPEVVTSTTMGGNMKHILTTFAVNASVDM
jgi:hypothetical protein